MYVCSNSNFDLTLKPNFASFSNFHLLVILLVAYVLHVSTGATGATEVAPKFSDTLTLSPPGRADSAHPCRGRI